MIFISYLLGALIGAGLLNTGLSWIDAQDGYYNTIEPGTLVSSIMTLLMPIMIIMMVFNMITGMV